MAGVSVDVSAVTNAISLCKQSIQEFNKASGDLERKCQDAGTTWKDAKYQQLSRIVGDCTTALSAPVKQLEDCIKTLEALKAAIVEYEQTKV